MKSSTFAWFHQNTPFGNRASAYRTFYSVDFIIFLLHLVNLKLGFSLVLEWTEI
jgi:hypothetical protein